MYKAPDFVKVSVSVRDVFAGYDNTGCAYNSMGAWNLTGDNCKDTDPNAYFEGYIYTNLYPTTPYQCYSKLNP